MRASETSPPAVRSSEPAYLRPSPTTFVVLLAAAAAVVAAARVAEVDLGLLFEARSRRNLLDFLAGFVPPAHSPGFLRLLARPVVETVQISLMGTAVAVGIGLPLALAGTRHLVAGRLGFARYVSVRLILNGLRAIPELVWALLVIRMGAGLGPFAAVLAIGLVYGGMLGKVYSELFESVPQAPVEALKAAGASPLGVAAYGLVPLAFPALVSYTLYRWECAIRSAAVLGLVGAGGLGLQLELAFKMFAYDEVATILLVTVCLVTAVDRISAAVRRALA